MHDRLVGAERERVLVAALGELPLAAALVNVAELLLEPARRCRFAVGRRRGVGGERRAVGAAQRVQVADRLLQPGGVRVPERDRRLEVRDGLERRRQRARVRARRRVGDRSRLQSSPASSRWRATIATSP